MLIHLHSQATTTPKVRAAIQASDEVGTVLAEMGAVTLTKAGSVVVATLTEKGARHLRRAVIIKRVKCPSRPGE